MKKIIFFVLFFAFVLGVRAQELIVVGGAGLQKTDSTAQGQYGFIQTRLMIKMAGNFRMGPFLGYTQYGAVQSYKTPNPKLLGEEFSYGLSFDNYGSLNYTHSYYWWINTGGKSVRDKFQDGLFKSYTKTTEIFVSGGVFVTDEWQSLFGNNRLMFEYQKPFKSNMVATWNKESVKNLKPYNKESVRIYLESGVKRFGKKFNVEPLIHAGYGRDFGRSKDYYEVGGGIDIGVFKEWYRDLLKFKVFWRDDFNSTYLDVNSRTQGGSICFEIVANVPLSLLKK
jgi:hypothetical protein